MCLLIRVASVVGRGSNQTMLVWVAISSTLSSVDCAEQRVSIVMFVMFGDVIPHPLSLGIGPAQCGGPLHLLRIFGWPRVLVDTPSCGG